MQKPAEPKESEKKKKVMRLEERQKRIVEKNKAHKMLKQISDESSDGESDNESEKKKVQQLFMAVFERQSIDLFAQKSHNRHLLAFTVFFVD